MTNNLGINNMNVVSSGIDKLYGLSNMNEVLHDNTKKYSIYNMCGISANK